ncbi:MAG TPA: DUF2085 domain-containing protein [Ktedonobacterales bacterium]|nr:DUF2085 domain-containing protein [Ktedonobacterales bacterium]
MALQQAQPKVSVPRRRLPQVWEPPTWALLALAVAYVAALAALIFLPGATLLDRLRALDGGICSQIPSHSFYPAGEQLPLCARNTGVYLGFALGFLTLLGAGRVRAARLPSLPVALLLLGLVGLMGVDGFNSLFLDLGLPHLYPPQNPLRLLSGLGTGVAMVAFITPVSNGLLWRHEDARPSFRSFAQLAVVVPLLLLALLAVGSQTAWLLYPIALLSSLGLALALSLVNLVFLISFSPLIGRFERWRQVAPIFTLALSLAVIELIVLFKLKLAVMHALALHLPPTPPLH